MFSRELSIAAWVAMEILLSARSSSTSSFTVYPSVAIVYFKRVPNQVIPEARYLPHNAPTASTTVISAAATESASSTPKAARSATKMYVTEYFIYV